MQNLLPILLILFPLSFFFFFFFFSSKFFYIIYKKTRPELQFSKKRYEEVQNSLFSGASLDNNSLLFTTLICDFLFLLSICPKLNIVGAGILFYILDVYHWQKTELLGYWHSMGVVMPVMIKSLQNNHWNGITQPPCYSEEEKVLLDLFKHLRKINIYFSCEFTSVLSPLLYSFWKPFLGEQN